MVSEGETGNRSGSWPGPPETHREADPGYELAHRDSVVPARNETYRLLLRVAG